MGGNKRGRTQRRHFRQGRENVWKKPRAPPSASEAAQTQWEPLVTQNLVFEQYYKEQRIIPEEEWDEFISILQKPLPAAFRINSSGQFSDDILSQLENEFLASLNAEDVGGNVVEHIRPLPWYPGKLAWHLNFSRMQLRKNQVLERIHKFLKQENEVGNITRQEAVSMVPPLFLDVQSHHYVLDMCAAPGSKTFQLLEMIHKSAMLAFLPKGMVIANDADVQRCNLLIHQTKRMCSANLLVTNHEAQNFPSCHCKNNGMLMQAMNETEDNGSGRLEMNQDPNAESMRELLFDRILCDVPCSGDGTIRKAPDIWKKWNAGLGNGVHRLQVQIAMRGVALLKVGGKLVYSTCSMNPVEDEAVVGEVLRQSGGSVELLDVSSEFPELKRRPGLKSWKVRDRGNWLTSYRQVDKHRKTTIVPSMFPSGKAWKDCGISDATEDCKKTEIEVGPEVNNRSDKDAEEKSVENDMPCEGLKACGYTGQDSSDGNTVSELLEVPLEGIDAEGKEVEAEVEVSSLPLERCMRIVPHDQDTGGFFIAVFQKVSHFSVEQLKSNEAQRRRNLTCTQGLKQSLLSEIGINKNKNHIQRGEIGVSPVSLPANDGLLRQQDIEETELEALNSDLHSSALNGIDSIPSEGGNGEHEIEDGQKKAKLDNEDRKTNRIGSQGEKRQIQQQGRWRGVDPVLFFMDENAIKSIVAFYGIDESFSLQGHLVSRNSDTLHVKRIYYVSSSVHDAIKLNLCTGQHLKITSVGLKMFERQTAKEGVSLCSYRISSEGLPLLLPYLRKQVIYASKEDFELLLSSRTVSFAAFQDPEFRTEASNLVPGCCVLVLKEVVVADEEDVDNCGPSNVSSSKNAAIAIGCWKGRANLTLMVSQIESEELLERLFFKYGREMPDDLISKGNDIHEEADKAGNILDNDTPKEAYETTNVLETEINST